MELCLAVDVGGTKMAAGAVDQRGALVAEARVPTPLCADADGLFAALSGIVGTVRAAISTDDELVACGVGCGGPMENGGETVSPLNIPGWRAFPLHARISALTGLTVTVDNDAKALALGEAWCGAAVGRADFMAMVVSTGVGGGIVLDGRLLKGAGGNAGHVGHVVVEPDGRRCACGGRGCLEAEASGSAIEAMTGAPAAQAPPALVGRAGMLVGRAVASVVHLLDIDLVAVAGSVALGFGAPFFEAATRELEVRAGLEFARGARIVPAGLGARGPLVGAAAVGWHGAGRAVTAVTV
ncbi:MAG: ROK family protein [Acidimicrobiales bacterium]